MHEVVIIGDSSNNTLGVVRSFGETRIAQTLILICKEDVCFVRQSKYLRYGNCFTINMLDECLPLLEKLEDNSAKPVLMTTFDAAAQWVDEREAELSRHFITPCRGKQLGRLFDKSEQCRLASECGLLVPRSVIYHRGSTIPDAEIGYPLITKPLVSSQGEKGDIHICHCRQELEDALQKESHCQSFLLQEFIEKEYEIDAVGVSTDNDVVFGGAIHKHRHWPPLTGAGAFGVFERIETFDIDTTAVKHFLAKAGYHGPFSVEFVHAKDGRNYFMEVNFRNEGLAYASTCAGANLHALYVRPDFRIDWQRFKRTWMMNYSIDLLYVKQRMLSRWHWLRDFLRTRCFINLCFSDLGPTIAHYKAKWRKG
ncbi:MAG: hypothetical protein PUJ61_10180 [Spirochaetia bacterium]|nr:hypothetical protein [Spirochaetia bacterium]